MSDDEQMFGRSSPEPERRRTPSPSPVRDDSPVREASPEPPKPKPIPQSDEPKISEAQKIIAQKKEKDSAKMEEEMREYEEMRKEERDIMEKDIAELREKREVRKRERAEEERIMNEKRQAEDARRRAEEEERQRLKREQEQAKRAAREQARIEAEERAKNIGKRSFVIHRKSGGGVIEDTESSKEEITKSKEQLEAEKQAILSQRVQPLAIDGFGLDQLKEKARELHARLVALVGDKYDLENQCKAKNTEMSELAERARSVNKGRKQKVVSEQDDDPMSQKFAGAPPKIQLCSKYERHTDRRNYGERKDVFTGPIYAEETPRILPSWEQEGKPNPFEEAQKQANEEEAAAGDE